MLITILHTCAMYIAVQCAVVCWHNASHCLLSSVVYVMMIVFSDFGIYYISALDLFIGYSYMHQYVTCTYVLNYHHNANPPPPRYILVCESCDANPPPPRYILVCDVGETFHLYVYIWYSVCEVCITCVLPWVCCVALPCCLFDLPCFFPPSHLSLKHVHVYTLYNYNSLQ